jgi:DNA-binding NtrC family response regulator
MHLDGDDGQQLPVQAVSTVLIIDGDPASRAALVGALDGLGYASCTAATKDAALAMIDRRPPAAILLDACLAGSPRPETLLELRARAPDVPVIMITASACSTIAIEAMRHGASDYLLKPFQVPALFDTLAKAVRPNGQGRPTTENRIGWETVDYELLGSSERMREIFKLTGQVAASDVTVLIQGESGTGKELIARAVHRHGRRASQPFLPVNCAAIPEQLLETEIFGHERGAFTSATSRHAGRFEQAHGGSLFLDEIGDMPLPFQAKLLRVLQDGYFERLGGDERVFADVRLIVATRWQLESLVRTGRFRDDLFHRLNVVLIEIPSLRQRREDIPLLSEHFVKRHASRLGKPGIELADETLDSLSARHWPGNVRELEHCIEQAIVRCTGGLILPEHTGRFGTARTDGQQAVADVHTALRALSRDELTTGLGKAHETIVNLAERAVFQEAFEAARGNLSKVAGLLGLSRPTVLKKLRAFNLR